MEKNIKIKKLKTLFITFISLAILSVPVALAAGCSLFNKSDIPEETETGKEEVPGGTDIQEEEEPASPVDETDKSREIESEFNLLEKTVENIEEIFDFIDENIADSSPELASNMIHAVIKLCEDYRLTFGNEFSDPEVTGTIYALSTTAVEKGELDLEELQKTDDIKVKDIIEEAINKKYKLIMIEGMIEPIIDYGAYDKYRQYLTLEMNDYLDIKVDESEKPALADAAFTIPVDDYIQRILKSMKYLEDYPDSPRFDEIRQFTGSRIWVYLNGIDNEPVFDSNNRILPDKLTEFRNILEEYSDTGFGEILASYLDLLEQENYIRTQEINDFLNDLYKS